jgi:hypothetical protein
MHTMLNQKIPAGTKQSVNTNKFVFKSNYLLNIIATIKQGFKTVTLIAFCVIAAYNATAQDFDKREFPGMDVFSRPNNVSNRAYGDGDINSDGNVDFADAQAIYTGTKNDYADVNGDGEVNNDDGKIIEEYVNGERAYLPGDWNKLDRTEKIDWVNKRFQAYSHLMSRNIDCEINTDIITLNFRGVYNFENYVGFDRDNDGKPEGYDYYKDKVLNGRENIPAYAIKFIINNSPTGHVIPGFFVGPNNFVEKHNPLDIKQWYFLDYNTGEEAKIGELIDPDEFVNISWVGWVPYLNYHHNSQPITFHLDNGIATYKDIEITKYLLFENPHTEKMSLKDIGKLYVERGANVPDLNPEVTGEPEIETTLVHYIPVLSHEDSEKEYFDSKYPEYFSFTRKFMADVKMGRWHKKDSLEQKIIVDDTTAPIVVAPENVTIGYNASLGTDRTGIPSQSDDSPYTLNNWFEDKEISNDGNLKKIERTFYSEDVRGNLGEDKQMITIDLNVGIDEVKTQKGFDIKPQYSPNGVNLKLFTGNNGSVYLKIFNINGKLIYQKKIDSVNGNAGDFRITNNGIFKPGTYIVRGTFYGSNGNVSVDTEKIFLK